MTALHETAYPRLKPNLTSKELEQNFAPSLRELFLKPLLALFLNRED